MGDALPGQSAPGLGRGSIFGVGGAGQVSHNPVSQELHAWQRTGERIEHYVSHRPIRLP